ncbi:hypothetical protein ACFLXV_00125 [Chloroflexota bacterium]
MTKSFENSISGLGEFLPDLPDITPYLTTATGVATIMGGIGAVLVLAFIGLSLAGLGEMRRQDQDRRGQYRRM